MKDHPMDDIPVRQLRFRFDQLEHEDPIWSRSSPDFARFINALGIHVPYFERFLVKVMRAYRGEIEDRQLIADVQAIIGQESHHAYNFVNWTRALSAYYPGLDQLDRHAAAYFDDALRNGSKRFHVGFTAGYETFTFLGGMIILNRYQELMGDADPTLRALWVWHQVEEVEHGAVAFDFYRAFYPEDEWYRRWMIVYAFCHIGWETFKAFALMMKAERLYDSPGRALKAWRFFAGFAFDLAWAALPVFRRNYHPRLHPICNDEQNAIAIAWRRHHAAGNNVHSLDAGVIETLLSSTR